MTNEPVVFEFGLEPVMEREITYLKLTSLLWLVVVPRPNEGQPEHL